MTKDWEVPFFEEPILFDEEKNIPQKKIYSISELTSSIKLILEDHYPLVWVEGEISNCKGHHDLKHLYFTLKDSHSQIDAIMFSGSVQSLSFKPENGLQVLVQGRITLYAPQGRTQIIVHTMEPRGKGALYFALQQLKIKLQQEGLFEPQHKKSLPLVPQRIGLVTSPSGAAIIDILKVVHQRHPNLEILIYPSRVQGDEAPAELIEGITWFNRLNNVDVIIITRGGGSIEDLWAFNDEKLAHAIYQSVIPIISAVGHEIDQSISDLVADINAPTPTAAALLVVRRKDELIERIHNVRNKLHTYTQLKIERSRTILFSLLKHRNFQSFSYKIENQLQHIAELSLRLAYQLNEQLIIKKNIFNALKNKLSAHILLLFMQNRKNYLELIVSKSLMRINTIVAQKNELIGMLTAKLTVLNPYDILKRGYSICFDEQNKVIIKDASAVAVNQKIMVKLHKGSLKSHIIEVINEERTDE